MMKSLFSGVSGLKNHTVRMDVIGNNIANVNTTGYKANTVTFRDVFYQTRSFASAGDSVSGGTNPRQVGYGLSLGSIDKVMTQSGLTFSDSYYDCAIIGEGFFQVMDPAGNIFFTRNGVFNVDNAGNLVDSNGFVVLGVSGDPTGLGPSSQRINLFVPDVQNEEASFNRNVTFNGQEYDLRISASTYGPAGNIAINITHSPVPFATMNGSVLTVNVDLTQDFADAVAFQSAINEAIAAGGVNPGDGVLPLNIEFSSVPASTSAISAANTFNFGGTERLSFAAVVPGIHANRYEITMRTTNNPDAERVRAQWNQNVLTITVNETATPAVDLTDIQNAINQAAGMNRTGPLPTDPWDLDSGNQNRRLTVSVPTVPAGSTFPASLTAAIGENPRRIGLTGGQDNFYRSVVEGVTMVMENGRLAGAQSVRDLDLVFIDSQGVIFGEHAVHGRLILGRIDIAIFQNANGLEQIGTSYFKQSLASGAPEIKIAESDGAGSISSGSLEMANVDLSEEFSNMIITQRGFQANSRIITVSDTMLEELINLKR
jgi:flagellar hook protein FlgE